MADTLYPIPKLPPAGPLSTSDLLHVRQGNVDRKLGMQALLLYLRQTLGVTIGIGPPGPKGDTGDQGDIGPPGEPGNQEVFLQASEPTGVTWPALWFKDLGNDEVEIYINDV